MCGSFTREAAGHLYSCDGQLSAYSVEKGRVVVNYISISCEAKEVISDDG